MIGTEQKRKLPTGWKWVNLTDLLISLETGSRPKGGATGILEGIPSISAEHMTSSGTFDFTNLRFVPEDFYKEMVHGHINRDDILVVKDGATTGKVCFIDEDFPFEKAVVNEHVFLCRPNKSVVVPYYLFLWLWSLEGQTAIRMNFQGAAIGGINQKFVNSVNIPLPPLAEQMRIARFLTEQMAAAEKAKRACQEKLEAAEQLPASYLSAIFNSEKAKQWTKKKLGEVCDKISNGTTLLQNRLKEGFPVTRIETISFGTIDKSRMGWINISLKEAESLKLCRGDILLSHINSVEKLGNCAIYEGEPEILIHGMNLLRIQPNLEDISALYLLFYFRCSDAKSFYETNACRAIGQASLNIKVLSTLEIPLPPLPEQKRIAGILTDQMAAAAKVTKAIEEELEMINKLPASILQQAFTGKL